MMRFVRELRLIPIVLMASACLLVLKAADLMLGDSHRAMDDAPAADDGTHVVRVTPGVPQASTKGSWAQQMFNFPDASGSAPPPINLASGGKPPNTPLPMVADKANADIITGSVKTSDGSEAEAKADAGAPGKAGAKDTKDAKDSKSDKATEKSGKDATPPIGIVVKTDGAPLPSGAERAILERLQERRAQLDTRARELDIREGLVQSAEKRVEARLGELKDVEAQITAATEKKNEAESVRFKGLVTMYQNMKPRDAAKIFDRLEIGVLIEVASQINPRSMADIMAQMSPDMAEHLTVELASRARAADKPGGALPKIEGRPMTP
jgi:flagellar motility protein MotE (MotC chaperone)